MEINLSKKQFEQRYIILSKQLEEVRESLKKSKKEVSEYRQIVENAKYAIIKISLNEHIEFVNPFAVDLFGSMKNETIRKRIFNSVIKNKIGNRCTVKELMTELLAEKSGLLLHEKKIKARNGTMIWISWTIRLIFDEKNIPGGIVVTGTNISQRKFAEDALRESEFNLTKAQEVAKTGSWAWEIDSDNIDCSEYFFKIFGIPPSKSYKFLLNELNKKIFPEYRDYINQKIKRAIDKGSIESFTYRIQNDLGEIRWIMEEVSLLGDIDKKKQILIGSIRDITDQKKAEDKLKEYLLIVSSSSELMSLIDPEYRYVNVNQAYLDAYKKNVDEIEGHTIAEMFGDTNFEEIIKPNIDKCLLGEHLTDQYWFTFPNGKHCYLDVKYNPVLEIDGTISGVTVSARDITDVKKVEEQLRIFKLFAEESEVGFGMADINGNITYVNSRMRSMAGFASSDELIGTNISESYLGNYHDKIENEILPGIKSKGQWTGEIDLVRKDGIVIHTIENFFIIRDEYNKAVSYALTVTDITDRKLAEKALQQSREEAIKANKAKSEFLANMSHEIRTPLNAVIGFTELLETMVDDKKQISYLQSIKSGGKNLLMLINDILDLSKIEAGKLEFKFEPINPWLLIDEIKQIFSIKIHEKDLDFIVDVDKGLPVSLILDEVRVRQVIFNLIGNAIKFTERGFVKFKVKKIPSQKESSRVDIIVNVEDTGIGIPDEQQQRIFDAFQQQSGQSTRKYGGTGLGLSISKRLVEMMGGSISLKSEVGKGSVFSFILKEVSVGAAIDSLPVEDVLDVDNIEFEPTKIMIVDDVESNRRIISENFKSPTLKVIEAKDGHEAVLLTTRLMPDIAIMDIRMPVMDGFEAAKQIKTKHKTSNIKIIALTASMRSNDQDEIYEKYFDGYLKKPVTRVELFRELMRFRKFTEIRQKKPVGQDSEKFNYPENEIPKLTKEEIMRLLKLIDGKLYEQWKEANTYQMSDEIEKFAKMIMVTGEKFKYTALYNFGNQLAEAVDHFDLEIMDSLLKNYPNMIHKLKNKCCE